MFPRPHSRVTVTVAGEQPQTWTVPRDDRHDFAADRHSHYSHDLGQYAGSQRTARGVLDKFERGSIEIID